MDVCSSFCAIDWNRFLSAAADISVIVAAIVAIVALGNWRREARGHRQMEVAEEALALIYEIRDAISAVRSPMGFMGESADREIPPGETAEQKAARNKGFVVFSRLHANSELFNRFYALRYRFEAFFGENSTEPFREINGVLAKLRTAARMYASLWDPGHGDGTNADRYEKMIYEMAEDPKEDPLIPKIDEAVRKLEDLCKPKLF